MYLLKSNSFCVFSESLTRHVQTVLANDTAMLVVTVDTAVATGQCSNGSKAREHIPAARAFPIGARVGVPDVFVSHCVLFVARWVKLLSVKYLKCE